MKNKKFKRFIAAFLAMASILLSVSTYADASSKDYASYSVTSLELGRFSWSFDATRFTDERHEVLVGAEFGLYGVISGPDFAFKSGLGLEFTAEMEGAVQSFGIQPDYSNYSSNRGRVNSGFYSAQANSLPSAGEWTLCAMYTRN